MPSPAGQHSRTRNHVVQDCFSLKVRFVLVGLIRCGWKHRWVKYTMSQAISGKANSYSLMYPLPSRLTIPRGSRISQQTGHLLGEGRIRVSYPKNPLAIAGNNFPWDGVDTPPKWPLQISFLNRSTLVDLCTKQSLLPAYSRPLWVHAPSGPSQSGWSGPLFHPAGRVPLRLSAHVWRTTHIFLLSKAAVHYLPKQRNRALNGWILPEGRGTVPPLGNSSHKASGWPQMRPVSSKWGVSQPMHQML